MITGIVVGVIAAVLLLAASSHDNRNAARSNKEGQ